MSEYTENHDRNVDENLRAAAPSLGMPGTPSAEQIAAWRTPAALPIGDGPMARRRVGGRRGWLAAGSAVAATLAIGAVLFTQTAGTTVQASTILANLRQKQVRGVNLTFDNLSGQGITVNGVVKVRSKHSITLDQMDTHDPFAPGEFGGVHAQVDITTDADFQPFPNTQWHGECAFTDQVGWAYVKMGDAAADALARAMPESAMLANMARNGVVLNIGPITEELLKMFAPMDESGRDQLSDDEIKSINEATENFEKMTGDPGKRLNVEHGADGKRHVTVSAGVRADKNGAHPVMSVKSDDDALDAIALRMLNGTARQAELDQLKNQLNKVNQAATVQNLGGGRYLLTADLNDPENPQNGREATLRVQYEENGGVQWAEVGNLRDATGTIRIEFVDDDIDPALLDYQRLVEVGKTGYVDLKMLKMLMGK